MQGRCGVSTAFNYHNPCNYVLNLNFILTNKLSITKLIRLLRVQNMYSKKLYANAYCLTDFTMFGTPVTGFGTSLPYTS